MGCAGEAYFVVCALSIGLGVGWLGSGLYDYLGI